MKQFFGFLTVGLILVGFFFPLAWIFAIITGIVAIGAAPSSKRPDGHGKTGGLLGGVWDDIVISYKMIDCPYCKAKIMKDALKCAHCGEWVQGEQANPKIKVNKQQFNNDLLSLLIAVGLIAIILLFIFASSR